jgi:hypothetical protein
MTQDFFYDDHIGSGRGFGIKLSALANSQRVEPLTVLRTATIFGFCVFGTTLANPVSETSCCQNCSRSGFRNGRMNQPGRILLNPDGQKVVSW